MNYDASAINALSQIAANGKAIVIRRFTDTHDLDTDVVAKALESEDNTSGVFLPISKNQVSKMGIQLVDGMEKRRWHYFIAPASGASFDPEPPDEVEVGGKKLEVIGSRVLDPGGVKLLYKVIAVEK